MANSISQTSPQSQLQTIAESLIANNSSEQLATINHTLTQLDNNNNLQQLSQSLSQAISASNNSDKLCELTQSLTQAISANNNTDKLSELTQAISTNNNADKLTELTLAISANNNTDKLAQLVLAIKNNNNSDQLSQLININKQLIDTLQQQTVPEVNIDNHTDPQVADAVQAIAQTIDVSLLPVLKIMHHKIRLDHDVWNKVDAISKKLRQLDPAFNEPESTLTNHDEEIVATRNN
ncbi:hypothetical protein CJF42_04865 [Pseudoalteromonas sp. NBT06-2]|uniref:hypothetical protein n=1 Tax=Pseudoalteromonas sp. NBT06-2 TaxID=2025950 RepID=UPI000BA59F31|nr:hypothetical protein [Pseudoalteromonas sp. NBT06-2]PAJ75471.1 hypothetical protein CJF42_04865 [Pseudoalteromonas sp. NBT06-2]